MTAAPAPASAPAAKWSPVILTALLLLAAGLLFAAIYFALPADHEFYALVLIGILALFFCVASYFAEALSRTPVAQRSMAWGFFGMGFAVLFASVLLGPMYIGLSIVVELIALVVLVLALVVAVAFVGWRSRSKAATRERLAKREAWQAANSPSALDYAAARSPTSPQIPTPPPAESTPPRSP